MDGNLNTPISDLGTDSISNRSDKRGRALIGEEISFPVMKRSKTAIEQQPLFGHPATVGNVSTIPTTQNLTMKNLPFFGAPTQPPPPQLQQLQQYPVASAGMMNPHPHIAGHVAAAAQAAAAQAAMTAFMAQHMMGQHQQIANKPQNPMQNLMASYAMMQGAAAAQNVGGAASTVPVSVSSRSLESISVQPRDLSCSSSPSGNISAHGPVLTRDAFMQSVLSAPMPSASLPISQHSFPTISDIPLMLNSVSPVVATVSPACPSKIPNGPVSSSTLQGSASSGSASKVIGLPQSLATNPFLNMRDLSLEELEEFVRQLKEANQPIPQPLSMLLTDARRKEKKKTAKRVANRKSACTSRARKKAYVEEMEMANRKLRRQALILSLLPDLVVAITSECEISFISAQVERVLKYNGDDLIGANIMNLLVPASREALIRLVNKLLVPEGTTKAAATSPKSVSSAKERRPSQKLVRADPNSSPPVSSSSAGKNVISEESFPPVVVQVNSSVEISEDNGTDNSGSGKAKIKMSSITCDRYLSPTCNDNPSPNQPNKKDSSGSDDSSSDSKNLRNASEALNRNVLLHNVQRCKNNEIIHPSHQHTDDVNGATVTANNADAKLSSLQHRPSEKGVTMSTSNGTLQQQITFENLDASNSLSSDSLLVGVEENQQGSSNRNGECPVNGNSSDDSGYGVGSDSFPSREDSSSSENDENSFTARKVKPLAPTCTVCLVRMDLTTVWCEVTASIRISTTDNEMDDPQATPNPESNKSVKDNKNGDNNLNNSVINQEPIESTSENNVTEVKEVLLCLRPLRDGDKVGEELRFNPLVYTINEQSRSVLPYPIQNESGKTKTNTRLPSPPRNTSHVADVVTNVSDNVSSSVNSSQPDKLKQQTMPNQQFTKGLPLKKRTSYESKALSAARKLNESVLPQGQQHITISLSTSDTEKNVVESLMLMCNKPKKR